MGRFTPIAGAETALTREFGKHVFEIAELLRVSHILYNYRVWVVVCAVRYEPVSGGNSLLTGKLTGNFAILGPQKPISLHETTVLQRLFTKFPTQINRENILKNREFLSGNREFRLQGAQASISPTLVLRIAIV